MKIHFVAISRPRHLASEPDPRVGLNCGPIPILRTRRLLRNAIYYRSPVMSHRDYLLDEIEQECEQGGRQRRRTAVTDVYLNVYDMVSGTNYVLPLNKYELMGSGSCTTRKRAWS